MIYDDIVRAYTGFSTAKYSKLYGVAFEDVLLDVLENYPNQSTKSRHESLMQYSWESLTQTLADSPQQSFDNPKPLAYNSKTN